MNSILTTLIATDVLALSGFALTSPIFAVFIERSVTGGTLAVVGLSQTVYMVVKSLLQLAVGRFNDRDVGNRREFWTCLVGYAVIAIVPFLYLGVQTVPQLYAAQALLGVGAAFAYPGFMTIFTKFADRQREGTEWSLYSTLVFMGMAVTAALGGWLVDRYGFQPVFIGWGILSILGLIAFATLGLRYAEFRRDHTPPRRHPRDVPPVR